MCSRERFVVDANLGLPACEGRRNFGGLEASSCTGVLTTVEGVALAVVLSEADSSLTLDRKRSSEKRDAGLIDVDDDVDDNNSDLSIAEVGSVAEIVASRSRDFISSSAIWWL